MGNEPTPAPMWLQALMRTYEKVITLSATVDEIYKKMLAQEKERETARKINLN